MSEPEASLQDQVEREAASEERSTTRTDAAVPPDRPVADPALLDAREQAREALAEVADPRSIGSDAGHEVHEDHVLTLFFECRLPGYPGWRWAATLARVDEESPVTVLEVELLPGEGAVVAPEWVPWSVRLAQYREAQAKQAAEEASAAEEAAAELADEDEIDPEDDLLENDFSDYDDEIDGVDIDDEFDDSDGGSDDDSDEDPDDDSDEDDLEESDDDPEEDEPDEGSDDDPDGEPDDSEE
ncbi:DUF3027 domain-containing protein [Leucobacter sp. CSA1]|uniref:DUF3027 domain-containing protein n=1 Tax=Leucobacter chromiisoli TaxID=2796471 RepID=A0A934Q507_9MICO|nr:DUF3027 domain-containing protein [Leucobacter chromiisoli]MBK0417743.1 DUF3027 domain-containing protein [Leucobacter chromiisoli]